MPNYAIKCEIYILCVVEIKKKKLAKNLIRIQIGWKISFHEIPVALTLIVDDVSPQSDGTAMGANVKPISAVNLMKIVGSEIWKRAP